MRIRRALLALVTGTALAPAVAAPALAAASPWPTGTVFVAESGQRFGSGHLYAVTPGGVRTTLGAGAAEDVVVSADGAVYWVTCAGDVESWVPGVGARTVASGFNCPDAIALTAGGDLLVGDYAHLYRLAADGTSRTVLVDGTTPDGIVADEHDNIYFVDGAGELEVLPAGATTPARVAGLPYEGQYVSLRLSGKSDLVASLGGGKAVVSVPLNGGAPTLYGFGYPSEGAVLDRSGNVYSADLANSSSTRDQVDRLPRSGGALKLIANGLDSPKGVAVFPPVLPAARDVASIALTASASGAVPSWKKIAFSARVAGGAGTPNGLVQFSVGSDPLGSAVPLRNGVAKLTTALPSGSDVVSATYLGSQTRAPAMSSPVGFTVSSTATHTVLSTSSPSSVPDRTSVPVVATVSSAHGVPGGSVRFSLNGAVVQTVGLDGNGQATASIVMTGTSPKVKAAYVGDEHYTASTSDQLGFTVTGPFAPALSTTTTYGATHADGSARVAIALKVRGVASQPAPSGIVSADNGFTCEPLSPVSGADLPTSTAKCALLVPAGTSEYVTLTYGGDANYLSGSTQEFVTV